MKNNKNMDTPKVSTFFRILKYMLKSYPVQYISVIIALLISTVCGASNIIFSGVLLNTIINPLQSGSIIADEAFIKLTSLVLIMVGVYALGVACNFIYHRISQVTAQRFLMTVRRDLFDKMEDLPIKYFDTHKHGSIMSAYTNDADSLWSLISEALPQLISNVVTLFALFICILFYSIYLGIVVIVFTLLMFFFGRFCAARSSRAFLRQQKNLAMLEGYIEEMITGQKVIKVFNHEEEAINGFNEVNGIFFKYAIRGNVFATIIWPIIGNLGHLMYISVAITGGILITQGVPNLTVAGFDAVPITIGTVCSFLLIARQYASNIGNFSNLLNSVIIGTAAATRIFELLDEEREVDDGYVTLVNAEIEDDGTIKEVDHTTNNWAWKHQHNDGSIDYILLKGDIVLKDVDFGYSEDKMVLHDINCYAHAGQKIAFVGSTGAGKTTITNLINRFYDIADGKIRYDGININKIKKDDLRRSLGVVLQDVNLFSGTIMDNIRYGKLDATDEECIDAAKLANAHDFITRLPNGYQTELRADGANLSQGQRQLISIARAAVANPPVLILDEATSSIDTRTEQIVQKGMDGLMKGRTVFVIAHRLSTIRNSDAIMVLENGRIIERGSHEELIAKKGTYYQLYTGNLELS